jgi:hypothetical protein
VRFGLGRANVENQTLVARIKWAADLCRHFNVLLHAAARDEGRVEARENFAQRQRNGHPIAIDVSRKNIRSELAQFAERDSDCAARELGKNLFERDRDAEIADVAFNHTWLNFQRKAIENRLQRDLH